MSERPMIFSGDSVRAILDGRKTQTRRVIKFPVEKLAISKDKSWIKAVYQDGGGNWIGWSCDSPDLAEFTKKAYPSGEGFRCTYGVPGDRLWVRETWKEIIDQGLGHNSVVYRASDGAWLGEKWRSPIFMPRWASRITLKIINIRAERLQEISELDAISEGIEKINNHPHWAWKDYTGNGQDLSPIFSYQSLWDTLNAKRGYPWESNPFVWVIGIKRIEF
jgi:hypothetical protein